MNREGTAFVVVVEFHLGGIVAGFAVDEVADSGVFYDHARPERVSREAEEIGAFIGQNFDDDVGPASENVGGLFDFVVGKGAGDDEVEGIFDRKKIFHMAILYHGWQECGELLEVSQSVVKIVAKWRKVW